MSEGELSGVARVDALLFEPLAGLGRPRGVSAEDHGKALGRLRSHLAYMTDANLAGMRDLIARHAGKGVWPGEGLVRAWAFSLQTPPPVLCDYARSLVRSEMGRKAAAEGWAVELFQVARRIGPPPTRYVIRELRAEAETNKRKRAIVADQVEAGTADAVLADWLRQYDADAVTVAEILAAKEEGRAE